MKNNIRCEVLVWFIQLCIYQLLSYFHSRRINIRIGRDGGSKEERERRGRKRIEICNNVHSSAIIN